MRIRVSRRGWWICWCLIGSALPLGAWWEPHDNLSMPPTLPPVSAGEESNAAQSILTRLPLAFEPNRGQNDGRVLFLSRNPGYSLFLTARDAVFDLSGTARPLTFTWEDANPNAVAEGLAVLPGKRHYLRGNNPRRWVRDVTTYAKVRYHNLYPGIDLVYYGQQQRLEYDLVVAPGADPGMIHLGVAGLDALRLDDDGNLRLRLATRTLVLSKPVIYQETTGVKHVVEGGYVMLADNRVGFELANYDHSKPLIIDPVLSYSTYLGGNGLDQGKGVAVDSAGNAYVVGLTTSADFPVTMSAVQKSNAGGDADVFVAKFDSSGSLLFATYLGGSGADRGFAIAVDSNALYIVGDTTSMDFPTQNADQATSGGDIDSFIAKLSKDGSSLLFSTYLGGTMAEEGLGIAVDGSGNAYAAGATLSDDFPTTAVSPAFNINVNNQPCYDPSNPGSIIPCSDAYVAKYDAAGSLVYATYIGGSLEDAATAIAVNGTGESYVTGLTYSSTFAVTPDGFQQTPAGGFGDAFIVKLDGTGKVSYGTYLGGGGWDQGQAIAIDAGGNIYVTGATNSGSNGSTIPLPLTNALQLQYGGGTYDAFVAKINPTNAPSSQVRYLTYLGGGGKDFAFGIAVDGSGNAYVVGETTSTDFPLAADLQSTWFGRGNNFWGDAFITKINAPGSLSWSTYLGGADDDWANGVALNGSGGIYVVGSSFSSDFPMETPYQSGNAGNSDAILFKLTDSPVTADLQVSVSATPDPVSSGAILTYQLTVNNLSTSNDAGGVVVAATLPAGVTFKSAMPAGTCTAAGAQVSCNVGTIAAGTGVTTSLQTLVDTAGDITFTAERVRANQPDPNPGNDSASVTTTAAVGDSGGGTWSILEWLLGTIIYLLRRRNRVVIRLT